MKKMPWIQFQIKKPHLSFYYYFLLVGWLPNFIPFDIKFPSCSKFNKIKTT